MDRLVFGTQVELVTAVFIMLEFCMLIFQLALYALRPRGEGRGLYLLLLLLMLLYNITGGLFPDPLIQSIPLTVQEMIAYGTGFLMASYFPFYFYKAFELKTLRWHAFYGVPLFLAAPYLVFFVIVYAINGKLDIVIRYGMIVPFCYALVLLWVMFKAIRQKYQVRQDKSQFLDETAMYAAISPWAALAFFGLVEADQTVEVCCTNTGIIAITFVFFTRSIRRSRAQHRELEELQRIGQQPAPDFDQHCADYTISKREAEVAQCLRHGMTNPAIAEQLHISTGTVKTHIESLLKKTNSAGRLEIVLKLFYGIGQ